jgi:hypothetical protein
MNLYFPVQCRENSLYIDSVSDNCSRIPEEKSTDSVLRFVKEDSYITEDITYKTMYIHDSVAAGDGDLFRGVKVVFVITRRIGLVDSGLNLGHRSMDGD